MSKPSWQVDLRQALERLAQTRRLSPADFNREDVRLAFVGVGNELSGDDAAGLHVARGLQAALEAITTSRGGGPPASHVLVLEGGMAPENQTGVLRRFKPCLVILLDAADFGGSPGETRWLDWRETGGLSASSHTLPLKVLAGYLVAGLGCEVALLGIQTGRTGLDVEMSERVRRAVSGEIVGDLLEVIGEAYDSLRVVTKIAIDRSHT